MALCPELDIAGQGASIEEARANLIEALTLFFETASDSEVARRCHNDVFVTQVEVPGWVNSESFQARIRQRGSHRIMQKRLEKRQ